MKVVKTLFLDCKKRFTIITIWSYKNSLPIILHVMWSLFRCLLGYVCFLEFIFRETIFQTFLCLFAIRKVGQRKTLSSQRKIWLGFQESVFLENLGGKHFPEVVKNLEMSYYLLIISNLVLKLLIAIYILFWIFIF